MFPAAVLPVAKTWPLALHWTPSPFPCRNGVSAKVPTVCNVTEDEGQCQGLCVQPRAPQQSHLVPTASWPGGKEEAPRLHRVGGGEPLLGSCKRGF